MRLMAPASAKSVSETCPALQLSCLQARLEQIFLELACCQADIMALQEAGEQRCFKPAYHSIACL